LGNDTNKELKQEKEKRLCLEERYRSLLRLSTDGVVIYDMEGNTVYISPAFTRIYGWTLEELAGKHVEFMVESEKEATMAIIDVLVASGAPCHGFETKRYSKDGQILDVSISAARFNDHKGDPAGTIAVHRDISDKKKMELQIRRSLKMETIGTLAGSIAHDFNNLLMGILGRTSLAQLDAEPSEPSIDHFKAIEGYVKNAAELTRQLLGFARGDKYELKHIDLNRLITTQNRMYGRTKEEISFRESLDKNLWTVDADQGQLEQVLLSIYINAWNAMPGGGTLLVQTVNTNVNKINAGNLKINPGKYVRVIISDTGAGMDAPTQQRIFDPFFSTETPGRERGLGLASAYGIIKNYKGTITVSSEKDEGTAYAIYLPASLQERSQENKLWAKAVGGEKTVLIIDDENMFLEIGQSIMKKLGYGVLLANSGQEALKLYGEYMGDIDIVILDMIMPGMNGSEIYDRLKEIDSDVKVLLSSGYNINDQATDIMERGCNGFIQKPFNADELSVAIQKILP